MDEKWQEEVIALATKIGEEEEEEEYKEPPLPWTIDQLVDWMNRFDTQKQKERTEK